MNFRVNLKKKLDKYIKLNGVSYEYFNKADGLKSLSGIYCNGSTKFKTLFETSEFLGIDIRNLLMFNDYTYVFQNSFDDFEKFHIFVGKRFKKFRLDKSLRSLDIANKIGVGINTICRLENAKRMSLKGFYEYLKALEVSSDEFFLKDEDYEIIGNQTKNEISIEDFNNRIYELEEIKEKIVECNIAINPNVFPTLHGFFKICKSLRISPRDFFDFDKKEFSEDFKIIDIPSSANFIKQKLESKGVKVQRYIKLDSVFLFCNENNLDIKDFFDVLNDRGNIKQMYSNML